MARDELSFGNIGMNSINPKRKQLAHLYLKHWMTLLVHSLDVYLGPDLDRNPRQDQAQYAHQQYPLLRPDSISDTSDVHGGIAARIQSVSVGYARNALDHRHTMFRWTLSVLEQVSSTV
jgi:hypothetical protein